mmetsp:Transcript_61232/g.190258  ORF Transcript_61232/g.190258 Transcript_61232/m.190258 type:complete len:82 (+) Transcript_61232:636-881(+)
MVSSHPDMSADSCVLRLLIRVRRFRGTSMESLPTLSYSSPSSKPLRASKLRYEYALLLVVTTSGPGHGLVGDENTSPDALS